ncbi:hypothetical protein thsps21_38480 [Pseudomonas sp. No.21]|nr:hypothetical protein TUM20249_53070 [Pseudomonas tohonis]
MTLIIGETIVMENAASKALGGSLPVDGGSAAQTVETSNAGSRVLGDMGFPPRPLWRGDGRACTGGRCRVKSPRAAQAERQARVSAPSRPVSGSATGVGTWAMRRTDAR